jgi:integrase
LTKLMRYQAKTGVPVFVPLPPEVAEPLRSIPPRLKPLILLERQRPAKTYVADWQRSYRRLFAVADLRNPDGTPKRAHCHMFRYTFAAEMLLAGVPIDQASILLGHSSVRITEKHHSHWVRARQDQLEKSVQAAWQLLPGKGLAAG